MTRHLRSIYLAAISICFLLSSSGVFAQQGALYLPFTTPEKRAKTNKNLINSIDKALALPLQNVNEDKWIDAFSALELLHYNTPFIEQRISNAVDSVMSCSVTFKKALLQLLYSNYPDTFFEPVKGLMYEASEPVVFAMSAEYLIHNNPDTAVAAKIHKWLWLQFETIADDNPMLIALQRHVGQVMYPAPTFIKTKGYQELFAKSFLPGQTIMYSIQRKNRDYPGLVVIRKSDGTFLKDADGDVFNVPQLARSMSNFPYYFKNGNTPQGIYRMEGFGVSMSNFIGTTPNVQLFMPMEVNTSKFFKQTYNGGWSLDAYRRLLPYALKYYDPLLEVYYAAAAGRTEIIAHGSTIDPEYYRNTSFYPHTPSEGCLSTSEVWNGNLAQSNQQVLVNGLLKTGGANGYCVVVDLDDKDEPVTIEELLPLLKEAEKR
jgi:hypothetical protein